MAYERDLGRTDEAAGVGGVHIAQRDDPPGLELSGEVDASVSGHLASRLLERTLAGDGDVLIDARGLSFIDLDGTRALVRAAGHLPSHRRLVVEHAPRCLIRVLTHCGWLDRPGLVVVPDSGSSSVLAVELQDPDPLGDVLDVERRIGLG